MDHVRAAGVEDQPQPAADELRRGRPLGDGPVRHAQARFGRNIIEPRKPLAPTSRRAGWVGCNIRLDQVPEAGKVWFVRDGAARPREAVLEDWREMLFLRRASRSARGWLVEVLRCVEAIGRPEFTLADVYGFEPRLAALYPGNRNVRPKIRQQLQALRDAGVLTFEGGGRYRVRGDERSLRT